MFALLAHITMEEEPLLAAGAAIAAAFGAIGAVLGGRYASRRNRAEVKVDKQS